jgi:PAS domain S-box-containing protein
MSNTDERKGKDADGNKPGQSRLESDYVGIRSIDFNHIGLPEEVTDSGSYDFRWMKENAFGQLLFALPIPAILVDEDHSIVFGNSAVNRISEDRRKILGTGFPEIFSNPDDSKEADQLLAHVFEDRQPRTIEGMLGFDDRWMWGRIHLRSIRIKDKRLILGLVEDLTAEREQILVNEKYSRLFQLLPTGLIELAPRSPIPLNLPVRDLVRSVLVCTAIDGNAEFARICGYKDIREAVGTELRELLPYHGKSAGFYNSWIKHGFPISSFESRESLPDGRVRYVETTLIGIQKQGHLAGIWMAKRDITSVRNVDDEALRSQKLESIGVLAGGIAHDFNNILTGILGNINLARLDSETGARTFKRLEEAERAAWLAKDLTEQLLSFSKGGRPIKKVSRLEPLVREAVGFALSGSNVRCDVSVDEDVCSVEIDEGQMTQVVNNLAINADQAMPTGGMLSISIRNCVIGPQDGLLLPEGKYVKITLKDEGVGIPEEHIGRIFDPYFTTKQKGSGLGLATSYSIVKNHDGHISVQSKMSLGTTFCIYLPASYQEPSVTDAGAALDSQEPLNVLFMDDDETVTRAAIGMLEFLGHKVTPTCNGTEALHEYRRGLQSDRPYDVVIMDLTVPGGMGGLEATRELLALEPKAKVIVSSGYYENSVVDRFADHGFVASISKPYDVSKLRGALAEGMKSEA